MERDFRAINVMNDEVLRAFLYIRVSSQEQAMHGYSLAAQLELLEAYAKEHKMRVVGVYADEGKSASKALHKRTELLRMIDDMEAGKGDVILFKDISRWSRNSALYYRVQERIDAAGGYWIAVQQPYLETKTPTGRYQVTIMLGNAQLEAEQTSERIKFVNQSRIPKGGVPYGANSCPLGYTVEEIDGMKRMVKDHAKGELAMAFFDYYETHQSMRGAIRFLADQFGYKLAEKSARKMIKNTLYKGEYQGVQGYCEPYMTAERYDNIQRIRSKRTYTTKGDNPNRVYIFSSLLRCAECGRNLSAFHSTRKDKKYLYYRCKNYTIYKTCTHKRGIKETEVERWLLENIEDEMNKYVHSVKVERAAEPPNYEKKRKAIEQKLKRNKDLYLDGDIEKEEYTARKDELNAQLAAIPVQKVVDTRDIEDFLNSDWKTLYDSLMPHEKRGFWRSIVDYVKVTNDLKLKPYFFE